jgi:hypothetical protein
MLVPQRNIYYSFLSEECWTLCYCFRGPIIDLTACQLGQHNLKTRHGPCGIITAVVCLLILSFMPFWLLLNLVRFSSRLVSSLCCKPSNSISMCGMVLTALY